MSYLKTIYIRRGTVTVWRLMFGTECVASGIAHTVLEARTNSAKAKKELDKK